MDPYIVDRYVCMKIYLWDLVLIELDAGDEAWKDVLVDWDMLIDYYNAAVDANSEGAKIAGRLTKNFLIALELMEDQYL